MRGTPTRILASVPVSYGAAVLLLWLFFRHTDWHVLVSGFQSVGWLLLAGAVVVRLLSLIAASLRWQLLLAPVRDVPLSGIVAAMMMGMTVNTVASMQAAEVVRPYLLSRREHVEFSATLATVAVEWVLDALGVLALFIPALLLVRGAGAGNARIGMSGLDRALALFVLLALAGAIALWRLPRWMSRLGSWARRSTALSENARGRLGAQCSIFEAGLQVLHRREGAAAVACCALLVPFLTAVGAWMTLAAFGLPVSFASGFLVLGLITVGGMIPTPGAVGGFHAVCQLGLVSFFNIDRGQTVLPVIALHAVLYVPAALIGGLYFLASARTLRRNEA